MVDRDLLFVVPCYFMKNIPADLTVFGVVVMFVVMAILANRCIQWRFFRVILILSS